MFRTRSHLTCDSVPPPVETVAVFDLRHRDIVHILGLRAQLTANPVTYTTSHGRYACAPAVILNPAHADELAAADPTGVGRLVGSVPHRPYTFTVRGTRDAYWVRERRTTVGQGERW